MRALWRFVSARLLELDDAAAGGGEVDVTGRGDEEGRAEVDGRGADADRAVAGGEAVGDEGDGELPGIDAQEAAAGGVEGEEGVAVGGEGARAAHAGGEEDVGLTACE